LNQHAPIAQSLVQQESQITKKHKAVSFESKKESLDAKIAKARKETEAAEKAANDEAKSLEQEQQP
jgi:hypothetical protein